MRRIAQLLNLLALLALIALAGPRLEQAAIEAELVERAVVEEQGPGLGEETPLCLSPAEPAGPGGARKESGERELGETDGEPERLAALPPNAGAGSDDGRPADLAGIRQPHLRVNGSADAFGARC